MTWCNVPSLIAVLFNWHLNNYLDKYQVLDKNQIPILGMRIPNIHSHIYLFLHERTLGNNSSHKGLFRSSSHHLYADDKLEYKFAHRNIRHVPVPFFPPNSKFSRSTEPESLRTPTSLLLLSQFRLKVSTCLLTLKGLNINWPVPVPLNTPLTGQREKRENNQLQSAPFNSLSCCVNCLDSLFCINY